MDKITSYLKSQSRNKIVFHRYVIPELASVNIGLRISETIYSFKENGKIAMKVAGELDNILNSGVSQHNFYGRYLSVDNLGILFEQELKLDFLRLLDSYSQNNLLLVKWDGEIDAEHLYFLTKENGIKINIQNLSHIAI